MSNQVQMKERRAKSKLKVFLNGYASQNGITPKELAKTIGLKNAKEMNEKCWEGSFSDQELKQISETTGLEDFKLKNMIMGIRRKRRKPNYMREFISRFCKEKGITGQYFAEKLLDMSYNGLFIKLKRQNWNTKQLQKLAEVTGTDYSILTKLAINEQVPALLEDDGN